MCGSGGGGAVGMDGDEGKKELRDFKEWLLTRNMFTPTREVK